MKKEDEGYKTSSPCFICSGCIRSCYLALKCAGSKHKCSCKAQYDSSLDLLVEFS